MSDALAGDGFEARTATLPGPLAAFVRHYVQHWTPYRDHWTYEDGCVWLGALALAEASGARFLSDFVAHEVLARLGPDGAIRGFRASEYNIDNLKPGSVLLRLKALHPDLPTLDGAITQQAAQLDSHPRTAGGSYWHKQIYPDQVWLDGLYMAQPFQCGLARLWQRPDLYEDTRRQFVRVRETLRDPRSGLYFHGYDDSRRERWADPVSGCSPNFWGRAMGWYVMALVDCLELAMDEAPALEAELAAQLRDCVAALLPMRSGRGLWWQLLDLGAAQPGNYEETSASLMIAYACLKGARLGVLDQAAAAAGAGALDAVLGRSLSATRLDHICGVAGLGNTPYRDGSVAYYLSEAIVPNDPKGVAALLLAASERLRQAG